MSSTASTSHETAATAPATATDFSNIVLKSAKFPIALRNPTLSDSDVAAFRAILINPLNNEMDRSARSNGETLTLEVMRSSIGRMRADAAKPRPNRVNFVVVDLSDVQEIAMGDLKHAAHAGTVVGLSGFGAIHTRVRRGGEKSDAGVWREGNAGVMLNPEARGKGWGEEAMRMSIAWGFEEAEFDEVTAGMERRNTRMIAVMSRLGWPGQEVRNDKGTDEMEYSILREDFLRS